MNPLHRSITPRTLHLQRRDASERTSAARATVLAPRRVVVPLNAAGQEVARSGAAPSAAVTVQAASPAAPSEAMPSIRSALPCVDGSVTSENLLRGGKVVRILHNGESYQLRATRHGKLILTK
ncbi:hemin uptake protein HemP [Robbsia sp. Bb-Pol-6]|uniref:Hemin uptake protein HemP n=1 Tax=Robbsia betulipollinis TaxID=2981849 RepID=A0ABT3ZMP4_9BURK|nr:hemin uptake protein HemP [Robbsia betulipollinis]MCY0387790.1 hemin uptake protein HemP [Robbsia betulipollinis]